MEAALQNSSRNYWIPEEMCKHLQILFEFSKEKTSCLAHGRCSSRGQERGQFSLASHNTQHATHTHTQPNTHTTPHATHTQPNTHTHHNHTQHTHNHHHHKHHHNHHNHHNHHHHKHHQAQTGLCCSLCGDLLFEPSGRHVGAWRPRQWRSEAAT